MNARHLVANKIFLNVKTYLLCFSVFSTREFFSYCFLGRIEIMIFCHLLLPKCFKMLRNAYFNYRAFSKIKNLKFCLTFRHADISGVA